MIQDQLYTFFIRRLGLTCLRSVRCSWRSSLSRSSGTRDRVLATKAEGSNCRTGQIYTSTHQISYTDGRASRYNKCTNTYPHLASQTGAPTSDETRSDVTAPAVLIGQYMRSLVAYYGGA